MPRIGYKLAIPKQSISQGTFERFEPPCVRNCGEGSGLLRVCRQDIFEGAEANAEPFADQVLAIEAILRLK